jgi:hypothetical protein
MLADNDYKFFELIIQSIKNIDKDCQTTIHSIVYSHSLEILIQKRFKRLALNKLKELQKTYKVPFKVLKQPKNDLFLITLVCHVQKESSL